MGDIVSFPIIQRWEDRLKSIRFTLKKLSLYKDKLDTVDEYTFIVLENRYTRKFKTTGYSHYFHSELNKCRNSTWEYHGKFIVAFLNYVFIDNFEVYGITSINDLTIQHGTDFLIDWKDGNRGGKTKIQSTMEKVEFVIRSFYQYLANNCEGMKYIHKGEQIRFPVVYDENVIAPKRIKDMSTYVFSNLLQLCEIHYPHIKLALCLQAFGGLRRGEVCNVTKDKINFRITNDGYSWFEIDLRKKTRMRDDLKSTGNIKKRREQPIHPVFLSILQKVYQQHLDLIKDRQNPYGALFLNRDNQALVDKSYEQYFTRLVNLLVERLSNRGDKRSKSEANLLMSYRMNSHVLRHFFTKFIASLEDSKNPMELTYWRGDSSYESAITYLQGKIVDDKIRLVQRNLFEEALSLEGEV